MRGNMSQFIDAREPLAQQALDPTICFHCGEPVELGPDAWILPQGPAHDSCSNDYAEALNIALWATSGR